MSEKNDVQKDQFSTLKGRAVAGLLGEKSAKILADKYVDLKVSGEHFLTSKGRANHAEIRRF